MTNRIDPFDELAAMFLTAPQPQAPSAQAPMRDAPLTSPAATYAHGLAPAHLSMTELLMVGHLPVRAGLWLVPYADLIARQLGTVCLIRLDGQEPSLQLLRAPESLGSASLRTPLRQTIADLTDFVDVWMLRGAERLTADDAIDCNPDRITILSSADEAAVVAAYQTIKELAQAAAHPNRSLPAIGMAMVGCEADAAAAVIDRLNRTTVSFLGVEVKLVALLPRMDAGIKCTRYMTFGGETTPGMLTVGHWLEQSRSPSVGAAPEPLAPPAPLAPAQQPTMMDSPAVIGRIAPPPETFVHDARRILRGPPQEFAPEEAPMPPMSMPPVPPMPMQPPPRPPQPAFIPTRPAAAAAPAAAPPPPAPPPSIITPAERDDLLSAISPGVSGAKLPPKAVMDFEPKSPPSQRPTVEPDDQGQPVPLARFVSGLSALPLRPPGHERVEIAVDERGQLHLLARETSLRDLPVVERWAHAHREILAMACPQHLFDLARPAVCHVFSAEPATLADLHGSSLRLHVLAPVTLGDKTAWYAAPLNVVNSG